MAVAGELKASIYDVAGRIVTGITEGWLPAGAQSQFWNAVGHPSGIYLLRAESGTKSITKKVVLLK
jgi:hypothetical protein